ncbi:Aldo/keto reductase [Mollisia scopiformis]|uniref:Aldo/keto reductase n=1 Tax=Mollisia scopiformis TaxID=149040 RepID=A0A194XWT1_MOLSC|nr:Aldo/keto reductase [Mollisia scopiformis]KUJ24494.1 Aldo/keto reductase [Mollisia scopiformis]
MASVPVSGVSSATVLLNNGVSMPKVHLGVYQSTNRTKNAVKWALQAGYRAIDCAETYGNEKEVGAAIISYLKANPELSRDEIWFTTKLRVNTSYDVTRSSLKGSIKRTKLGYVDLYLLHTPSGGREKRLECWRALEDALIEGEVRSIGVSNYGIKHLQELLDSKPRVIPAVNQIEVHPFNTHSNLTAFCQKHGIVVQAYSPLVQGRRMDHPTIVELSKKHKVSQAQILLRWGIQKGFVVLPKSTNQERIIANADIWEFEIEETDMERLDGLDEGLVTEWDLLDTE